VPVSRERRGRRPVVRALGNGDHGAGRSGRRAGPGHAQRHAGRAHRGAGMNAMHGRGASRAALRLGLRPGFALLAVLWVMVAAAVLGTGLVLTARRIVRGATNRQAALVVQWRAEGCLARARAAITDALGADSTASGSAALSWRALDHDLAAARASSRYGLGDGCDVTSRPLGIQ